MINPDDSVNHVPDSIGKAESAPGATAVTRQRKNFLASKVRAACQVLGPGLITGAADDDPSGIATYSSVGAQFGYGMLWVMPFVYPFMAAIQEISARIGRVTGMGLAGNMRKCCPGWVVGVTVVLLTVANIFNLGADLGAMGAAVNLLIGGPTPIYCVLFAGVSVLLQVFIPYQKYAGILKWLTLSLFAYVATVFVIKIDWSQALFGTFVPVISMTPTYFQALVAVLGTTISPYLFFWQSSEEVEEMQRMPNRQPLKQAPRQGPAQLRRIKVDTYLGMAFSNLISYFIILAVAATLHAHGKTDVDSAAQAAEALRPLAGSLASLLFSLGIVGTGLLAIPVLAGSGAYAMGEALHWNVGLEKRADKAKAFYSVIALSTFVGLLLNFTNINPIRALVWSAIINGVTAAPIMSLMMVMGCNRRVMGKFVLPRYLRILGWSAALIMTVAALAMLWPAGR